MFSFTNKQASKKKTKMNFENLKYKFDYPTWDSSFVLGITPSPVAESEESPAPLPEEERDYKCDDLRQENLMIRAQLTALYTQLAKLETVKLSRDIGCQMDIEVPPLESELKSAHKEITELKSELSYQKALTVELGNNAKEMQRKIHTCELKILERNQEVLQTGPIKAKADSLTLLVEQLQTKLRTLESEYLNVTIEIKHIQERANKTSTLLEEQKTENMRLMRIDHDFQCEIERKFSFRNDITRI
jgi:chromosome segregation ATPase